MADIRQLYKPIQPTVKQSADKVTYSEFLPDIRLQNYIYCYWQLKTTETLSEPFIYRVVADGCIDIFFELNNPKDNFVMGFCKKFTEFTLDNSFHYIGVCFLPTMFPQLFRVNASELSNRFEQLCNVVPKVSTFIADNFHYQLTAEQIQLTFDKYFINLIENTTFNNDSRLYNAIEKILKEFGVVNIEQDLNTGISQRQLRRLFEFYIGDTAKTFAKLVRFQNILRAKPSSQSLRQNKLFFDVGYYDQAHFIKEFKNFYGVTPSKAFGR
ncbi:AraC family transcriptional regulator [Ignavibacterium album JCM 16511]|uniref:AraC family transcriptional regulator n=1 Tax=Ignavibacterium album (strain DSM 19864 / JCM 16511 / NBRC 101810 / Mat9-16) TaxID=945713 RepID=I0AFR5_IGNAJ|nr:helix-turn-helix domain-containing protein [Ignavibacterium album]AFH47822.1 AraC family transcriptional regulator [Ignavibacterium album JCM 16511]